MNYSLSPNVRRQVQDSDTRIVITGAGGWLGLATLELLDDALGESLPSRVRCFGSSRRELRLLSGTTLTQEPLDRLAKLDNRPTIVLHLAFLTKDRAEYMAEADYRRANRDVSRVVLDALDAIGTQAAFVASSGAAQFADDLNRSAAMRLYGELKKADEDEFASWAGGGCRIVIARIFNIAGPHINKLTSYALSSFIIDAIEGRPIVVKAPHRVIRGYVAIRELMSLVFALLLSDGPDVVRFDTGGVPMELQDVAKHVAAFYKSAVERAPVMSSWQDIYVGNALEYDRFVASFGIETVPFVQQIRETGEFLIDAWQKAGNLEADRGSSP